ncbi:MAG: arginase family protein, partial [Kiritimatiellae bacterium]|nr:arginase family protein [Kiritimatiellia bacterium]
MKPQTNQFIGCDRPFEDAEVVLFGAPYDSTTSFRPGTRFGPAAMRAESFGIETYSMLQDRDLSEDTSVFDSGDLELPFGAPDAALGMIEERAAE